MNVDKIQRLSKTHEDLSAFLKISCISGACLSIECGERKKHLDGTTAGLTMVAVRKGITDQLDKIKREIIAEVKHV